MSRLKDIFSGPRTSVPACTLSLITSSELTFENEAEFFENAKKKLVDVGFLEELTNQYLSWRQVIFQMYSLLEKHIQALQNLQANDASTSEDFMNHEKSINTIIVLLNEFLDGVDELCDFSFPYYDQLLELTHSKEILKNLADFSFSVLSKDRENEEALVHMSRLFYYTTPFIRLLYQVGWDNGQLVKNISTLVKSNVEKNKVSEATSAALIKALEYGYDIMRIAEEESFIGSEDKRLFVTRILKKMCENCGITREKDEQNFFQVLGEIAVAYHLLRAEVDEVLLADITTIQNFQGLFLQNMKYTTVSPKLHNLTLDRCHNKFKYTPHPSVVDLMLEKAREINEKADKPIEESIREIDILTAYTTAIIKNGQVNTTLLKDEDKQTKPMQEFLIKLYTINRSEKEGLPPIIEMLNYASSLYKKFYSTVNDENVNILGKLSDSPKDKVNILTDSILNMTYCYMDEMSRSHTAEDGEVQRVFSEDYYVSLNLIYKHMIHMLETYSFESNYTSVLGLTAIFVGFQELSNHKAAHYLQLPLTVIKKLESLVHWSYTKDFADVFERHSNPDLVIKILDMLLELLLRTLYFFEDEDLETEAKKDYLTHLSTFTTMDFIISKKGSELDFTRNQHAMEAHEKIIRLYTLLHLNSQILTSSEQEVDQIVFYTYERLVQVWDIIVTYSTYECRMSLEFYDSAKMIDYLLDRENGGPRFYKVFNYKVLSTIYDKSFLNLNVDHSMREEDALLNVLVSLMEHDSESYHLFLKELSNTLKKNFEFIQKISTDLQKKFEQNDPDFTMAYLYTEGKIFDWTTRVRYILRAMQNDAEENFSRSDDMKEVVAKYVPEFIMSPAFYLINLDSMRDFKSLINNLAALQNTFEKLFRTAATRVLELVNTVNEELQKETSVLKKKMVVLYVKVISEETFHSDTFLESPRDIYAVNSKLFFLFFLNYLPFSNVTNIFAEQLLPDVAQVTEKLVNILQARVKHKLYKSENIGLITYLIVDDCWMQNPYGSNSPAYFDIKFKTLSRLMTEDDATKTKEDNLYAQVSASLIMADILPEFAILNVKNFMCLDGNIERIMESSFTLLEKFQKIVMESQTSDESQRLKRLFVLFGNSFDAILREITKIISNCKESSFGFGGFGGFGQVQKDLKTEQKLLKRVFRLLSWLLDKFDHKLLDLSLLNEENKYRYISLHRSIPGAIYQCCVEFFLVITANQDAEKRNLTQPQPQPQPQQPSGLFGNRTPFTPSLFQSHPPLPVQQQTDQEIVKEVPEDSILQITQSELDELFSKFLTKMVVLITYRCNKFDIHPIYRPPFESFLAKCISFAEENVKVEELGYPFDIQIYKNPIVNRLRILAPIFYFITKFTYRQTMDKETLNYFGGRIELLKNAVLRLVDQITAEDLLKEQKELVEKDIMAYYHEIMSSMIQDVKALLISFVYANSPALSVVTAACEQLIHFLKKWSELIPAFKYTSNAIIGQFKDSDLILVLYAYLHCPGKAKEFIEDEYLLRLIVNHASNYLYIFIESFALEAYDADKILPLKLKSLIYLDKSGSSLIRNSCIKQLEKFWPEEIVQAWKENFEIKKDEEAKNEHAENIITIKESVEMKGKVNLSVAGENKSVSALSFLLEGMNPQCRIILEALMKSIVLNIHKHIEKLCSTDNDDKRDVKDYVTLVYDQIGCLAGLVKNYPELSVVVTSYKIEEYPESSQKTSSLYPKAVKGESFLRFFAKFACYLYRSPATNLLENLIMKHETPIFIQYKGDAVLLSAYNEIIVFQEIIGALEESLKDSEVLLKSLYSTAIWKILSELSIHLLNLPNWSQQKDFKLEIIKALYSVSLKTMETYYHVNVSSSLWKEEEFVAYEFLEKLSRLELELKTKRSLLKDNNKSADDKQFNRKLGWICSVLREQTYLGQNIMLEQTSSEGLSSELESSISEECELLKANYKPVLKEIELNTITEVLQLAIKMKNYNGGRIKVEDKNPHFVDLVPVLSQLSQLITGNGLSTEEKVVVDRFVKFFRCKGKIQYQNSMHADIEVLRLPPNYEKLANMKKREMLRVMVKKELKWRFAKKKNDKHLQELLKENPQEDFSQLIKKIGLKNISNLIKANRRRIKLLIRTQHEKQLLAKLQVLLDKQVSINDILTLETDVDNLEFYNQQSELDKKLILLLAQKDFIETLSQDIQQQSKSLKKALLDEENLKKAREEEGEEEEEKVDLMEVLNNNEKKPLQVKEQQTGFGFSGLKIESKPGEVKILDKKVKVEEKKEEEEEDDEDYEEVSDFSDEGEANEGEDEQEEEEENDEDFEDCSDEDEEEEKKEAPMPPQQVSEQKGPVSLGLFGSTPANNSILARSEDQISSACHTREVSVNLEEKNYDDEDYQEYDEYGEPLEILENEDPENAARYSYEHVLRLVANKGDNNIMITSNVFIAEFYKAEKILTDMKISFRSSEIAFKDLEVEPSIKEWANQGISLFGRLDSLHKLYLKPATSINLFFKYLFLALLDPSREAVIVPLLVLHLSGFALESLKNISKKGPCDGTIIMFLMHYALRSPSIFFRRFSLASFKLFFDRDQQQADYDTQEKVTLYDLLLKVFIKHQCERTDSSNRNLKQWTQRLVVFLTQMLFKVKEEMIPSFMREYRKTNETPITKAAFQQLLKAIEAGEDYTGRDKFGSINHLLKSLATIPSFNKEILITYEKVLAQLIPAEKGLLTDFMNKANEVLSNKPEHKLGDVQFFSQFVSHVKVKVAKSFSTFIDILNEIKSTDLDLIKLITESKTLNVDLKEVALDHMKAFELIFKLKEANYLRKHNDLRLKLEDMLEIPVHYHVFLSKVKELTSVSTHNDNVDLQSLPGMAKSISDQESLSANFALKNKDITSFQHILLTWLNKSRENINSTIKLIPQKKALDMLLVNKFSWVLDFTVKEKLLRDAIDERNAEEEMKQNNDDGEEGITVFIRRKNIIEDTLKEFEDKKHTGVLFNFKIEFLKEPGVDHGGLKKEWLTLISKELFDTRRGLFSLSPNLRTIHPNPLSVIQPGELTYFRLAGTIAGLAIKEEIPINVNFSKSFLKLLMGHQPNLTDLEDIEPELMHSLNWMLTNPISDLEMPFTYELDVFGRKVLQELIENGANVVINEENKESFVSKMYLAKAFKEVEKQIQTFKEGFYEVLPEKLLKLFSSGELEILISGQSEIDIEDLKKYAISKDMVKDHPLVKWFWEIVEIMDQPMLANLLFFITGSSQVPHGGFKNSPVVLMKGTEDTTSLPIAHTCFSQLEIPIYESKEQFYEKLVLAISEGKEGFYIA